VLDTLVRARALDSYGCQGVCCMYVYGDLQLTSLYAVWAYGFRRAEV